MARKPTKSTVDANELSHQAISRDIAEFRRRGGRIEVLGNTPLRVKTPTTFTSRSSKRMPPTPLKKSASG